MVTALALEGVLVVACAAEVVASIDSDDSKERILSPGRCCCLPMLSGVELRPTTSAVRRELAAAVSSMLDSMYLNLDRLWNPVTDISAQGLIVAAELTDGDHVGHAAGRRLNVVHEAVPHVRAAVCVCNVPNVQHQIRASRHVPLHQLHGAGRPR